MSTNLQTIAQKHHAMGLFGANGVDPLAALAAVGVTDCANITDTGKLCPPGFGHTSALYLALALAQEVCRLQAIIDNASGALAALQLEGEKQ